jgi:hypothetical protein
MVCDKLEGLHHQLMIGGQLVLFQQKATHITAVLFVDLDVICPTLGCCQIKCDEINSQLW